MSTGWRSSGGVCSVDISRMPVTAISSVRGIGVADIASTSTEVRSALSCSLCSTPKRCSSSMTTSPRSLNRTSLDRMRWVPMTRSTEPVGEAVEHGLGLAVALEAREGPHDDREPGVPLGEGVDVLLDEQRRRAQHGHLLAVLHRLERRAHRDLGLAVADVAADEAVHRHGPLHVGLDLVDGAQLVGRLDVGEGVLELALPRGVRREGVPARRHPRGVEPDQLGGDLLDVAPGAALGLVPVRAAHLVEAGLLAADVAGDLVELVGGHVEPVAGLAALGRRRTR